jgi:hypothetical protein
MKLLYAAPIETLKKRFKSYNMAVIDRVQLVCLTRKLAQRFIKKDVYTMSSQEPPFSEQPYPEIPPPSEQPSWQEQPYSPPSPGTPQTPPFREPSPYPGPQPQGPYYAQPVYQNRALTPRSRRGLLCGCLVALVLALLLCSGGVVLAVRFGFAGVSRSSATDPVVSYKVKSNPTLILNDDAGSVTIKSGSLDTIDIQATRYANFGGSINNIHTQAIQDTNASTLTVTVTRSGPDVFNTTGIDFVITVPNSSNLQISTGAGSLNISGVSGTMSLNTHAGTIGVSGATLTGSSNFKTNAGSVNFSGSIATSGVYDFETNAGSIDVTLSAASAFHLNANTDVGSISTSFPATVNHNTAGASINTDIGATPQATVTLKTNAGSITLNKGP